jgi:acetyl esterase/lipase
MFREFTMRPFICLLLVLVTTTLSKQAALAQNNLPPEVREMARKVMMPVVYQVPAMDKVKVVQNMKYTKTDDPNILMDIYQPPNTSAREKYPVVMFIHGGAKTEYTPKDWGIYTSWGRLVAASGFVGVTFTHRLKYPDKSLELAAQDVRAAIDYVRANSDKCNADPDRICLATYSAGGPMLSLAMGGEMPFVRCLIAFYSFMDVRQSDYRKTEGAEALKAFSPISYVHKDPSKIPPIFIARAGRDEVPTMDDSIDRFIKEGLAADIALSFANHPQGVHSFDNLNNDDRSHEIIRAVLEFMKVHLKTGEPGSQSSAGQTGTEKEVLQFEREACKAFLDADVAALERVLTPEFTLTLSNGEVSTRADEINELRSGKVHYDLFENYDMLARLYGNDTAVVLGKTRVKGTANGKPFDRVVQFTDTLIKRDGRWQLAAGHVSRIEK